MPPTQTQPAPVAGVKCDPRATTPAANTPACRATFIPTENSERIRRYNQYLQGDNVGEVREDGLLRAAEQRQAHEKRRREELAADPAKAAKASLVTWNSLGPEKVGGRVRAVSVDPTNPNAIVLGGITGGIWRTFDKGASWSSANDFTAALPVSTIARAPSQPATLIAGTGEWAQAFRGVGLAKSTDAGQTWTMLSSTDPAKLSHWRYTNRVAISPQDPNLVLAGNWGGVYRSTDGGNTWTAVLLYRNSDGFLTSGHSVAFSADGQWAVAGLGRRTVAYSRNAGATWTTVPLGTDDPQNSASNRVEAAFAPSDKNIVYASVNENSGDVYRSADGGTTWAKVSNPKHLGRQGDYGNALWIDPINPKLVVVGGIDLYRSTDSGATWEKISDWTLGPPATPEGYSAHADHHAIHSGAGREVFFGNDGGLWYTADIDKLSLSIGWKSLNANLRITQYYGIGVASDGLIVGGTQDNGTITVGSNPAQPTYIWGGDGGESQADPTNKDLVFGETQNLGVFRFNRAQGYGTSICTGILDAVKGDESRNYFPCGRDSKGWTNFIAPLAIDRSNPRRFLAGGASLWATDDVQATRPTWRAIKPAIPPASGQTEPTNYIASFAMSPSDPNTIWVGHNEGEVFYTGDAWSASPTWTRLTQADLPKRFVRKIVFDATRAGRMLLAYSGFEANNLWLSTDGGKSFRSISSGLPVSPVYAATFSPIDANTLYAGTAVGVYESNDFGASWQPVSGGPGAAQIRDFVWSNDMLAVATHGRGLWSSKVGAAVASGQTGWWWNPSESGRGFFYEQQGNTAVMSGYLYADDGRASWFIAAGTVSGDSFSAPIQMYANGQTLTGSYQKPVLTTSPGTVTLKFSSDSSATMTWPGGSVALQRLAFGPNGTVAAPQAGLPESGWWWNAAESGRGYSLEFQGNQLVMAGYMYDASGNPLWYLSTAPMTGTTNYSSTWTQYANGQSMTGAYRQPQLINANVGNVTIQFSDTRNGTMTLPDGRQIPITRLAY